MKKIKRMMAIAIAVAPYGSTWPARYSRSPVLCVGKESSFFIISFRDLLRKIRVCSTISGVVSEWLYFLKFLNRFVAIIDWVDVQKCSSDAIVCIF